ncbi:MULTISPECIES: RagB/SusD family nutrient uptake outer membrane protein [unclassified Leeuwenhoekiella]|uniref:RagB/SusD family nutrient uptake outer membrane protein n=1 Tax=unclassified Leeuwenhoekiella TaxID=2615029 RepID=UPI000C44066B|nr:MULTISPECIES: RagB/SusD family nutrient uptake outer membrane protein [unclassified Leeuwenhoekiella]MAW95433.1 RagB/SusD family nutrient uptake outer membrane protein [Leeuwenhoekiella sp.]MBA80820.1 RagB/SusD family nutrient uptake outer membrane protein [Leeuwenhoekiella sp.]|tara:strand:+ start:49356 stop:50975 length:1620 start_codon:yes stop_codon:yes gene_type:complete
MKKYSYRILFGLSLALLFTNCEKLDLVPENVFTDETYWTSTQKAQTFLNTAYSQMMNSQRFFYNEALSDNAYNGRGDIAGAASIASGTYDPSLGRMQSEWDDRYAGIKTTNLLLANIDRVPDMNEDVRTRMKAEARFLRAWQHFYLMTWFGDVPLLESDPSLEEALTITRTPREDVLTFVLDELTAIMDDIPVNSSYSNEERGRISKGAVAAFLARVHLYEGNWPQVVTYCEMIMNGSVGDYELFNSYSGLFSNQNQFSSEDILSLQYAPLDRTWGELFDMVPISIGGRVNSLAPTQELVDSYITLNGSDIDEPGSGWSEENPYQNRDPRLTATVVYNNYQWQDLEGTSTIYIKPGSDPGDGTDEYAPGGSTTSTGYYVRKYFDPNHEAGLAISTNLMLIRYADVLLMYAEAKHELGEFSETVWDETIALLRERAGFTDPAALNYPSGLNDQEMREEIRNERRVELALEGLRIFDIRRWEIAEDVLNGFAHGAQFGPDDIDDGYLRVSLRTFDASRHYLWPIPRDERLINPNLSQNPGW